ncbi:hypothetical protein NC651_010734 [Populus alba x Populus x berolinensis]|nr:hypothetical protein NC651_010734 [Populus alba x Populus x berolinensis]
MVASGAKLAGFMILHSPSGIELMTRLARNSLNGYWLRCQKRTYSKLQVYTFIQNKRPVLWDSSK